MRRLALQTRLRGKLNTSSIRFNNGLSIYSRDAHSPYFQNQNVAGPQFVPRRGLAKVRDPQDLQSELWFSSTSPIAAPSPSEAPRGDREPVDERKLKLGKTIRILRDRLPNLLANPLPQDILSPQITLRLFPSTHPHLPSVSGRIAYTAALWTSPVAWGRVPVVGNVKLNILSERMMRNGSTSIFSLPSSSSSTAASSSAEKFVVRWKTCGKTSTDVTEQIKKIMAILGRNRSEGEHQEFHGLFVFEFDEEGRIISHTIEHVEEGNDWEKTAKLISVTDWLLGRAWGKKEEAVPGLAVCRNNDADGERRS